MKKIEIEFTGAARAITGRKTGIVEISDRASYRDIVSFLAGEYPQLIGLLISEDRRSLLSANFFSRNGEEPILPDDMDKTPQDGERLVILYFIVGG
jgi:hypothetical protein